MDWTPIIAAAIGSGLLTAPIVWIVRGRVERWKEVQTALHTERRERYAQVLNPYVQLFASLNLPEQEKKKRRSEAESVIRSAEYRKELFDLALVAEDSVVRTYNAMMTGFQALRASPSTEEAKEALRVFGSLLVAIRRSIGNKRTHLNEADMLRAVGISDAARYLKGTPPVQKLPHG